MFTLTYVPSLVATKVKRTLTAKKFNSFVICGARGPRPRYPRVWKSRNKIGTISKSRKLVECVKLVRTLERGSGSTQPAFAVVGGLQQRHRHLFGLMMVKGLSNVKEEVYGALDSFVAWELEFPLIVVKKALKTLEFEKEWKRIIQVIKWMLSKGQGKTMGTYYTLLNALAEDGRLEEAEELWTMIFSENLECLPRIFFIKMMSIYYEREMHQKMFEVFADMEELGIRPDQKIVQMVGVVFQKIGMLDKYEKLTAKYPPPTWEYRYIKGKRVKIQVKHLHDSDKGVETVKHLNESDKEADTDLETL